MLTLESPRCLIVYVQGLQNLKSETRLVPSILDKGYSDCSYVREEVLRRYTLNNVFTMFSSRSSMCVTTVIAKQGSCMNKSHSVE